MAFKIEHVISKKVDETDSISHWFEFIKRPDGAIILDFKFVRSDGSEFQQKHLVGKVNRFEEKNLIRNGKNGLGYVCVVVPNGRYIKQIFVDAKLSVFGAPTGFKEIKVSENFEDVTSAPDLVDLLARIKKEI